MPAAEPYVATSALAKRYLEEAGRALGLPTVIFG
jgi:hypothetical protein